MTDASSYQDWSRDQLVQRVKELEESLKAPSSSSTTTPAQPTQAKPPTKNPPPPPPAEPSLDAAFKHILNRIIDDRLGGVDEKMAAQEAAATQSN